MERRQLMYPPEVYHDLRNQIFSGLIQNKNLNITLEAFLADFNQVFYWNMENLANGDFKNLDTLLYTYKLTLEQLDKFVDSATNQIV